MQLLNDPIFWWGIVTGVCLIGFVTLIVVGITSLFVQKYAKPVRIPPIHKPDNN